MRVVNHNNHVICTKPRYPWRYFTVYPWNSSSRPYGIGAGGGWSFMRARYDGYVIEDLGTGPSVDITIDPSAMWPTVYFSYTAPTGMGFSADIGVGRIGSPPYHNYRSTYFYGPVSEIITQSALFTCPLYLDALPYYYYDPANIQHTDQNLPLGIAKSCPCPPDDLAIKYIFTKKIILNNPVTWKTELIERHPDLGNYGEYFSGGPNPAIVTQTAFSLACPEQKFFFCNNPDCLTPVTLDERLAFFLLAQYDSRTLVGPYTYPYDYQIGDVVVTSPSGTEMEYPEWGMYQCHTAHTSNYYILDRTKFTFRKDESYAFYSNPNALANWFIEETVVDENPIFGYIKYHNAFPTGSASYHVEFPDYPDPVYNGANIQFAATKDVNPAICAYNRVKSDKIFTDYY